MKITTKCLLVASLAIALCALPAVAQDVAKDPNPPDGSTVGTPAQATGGPDGFGYTFFDQNEAECGYNFVDISATCMSITSGDDSSSGPVALPGAAFDFYGTLYTSLNMATNGYISTDPTDTGPDLSNDCPLPATPSTGGGARFYPLHDDLITTDGCFEYFASCPRPGESGGDEGCYIFQWNGVTHFGGGGPWDMQAVLYETSYEIVYQIGPGNPEQGSGSTTGLQNDGATIGLTYACNTANSVPDNSAVCVFHPSCPFGCLAAAGTEPYSIPTQSHLGLALLAALLALGGGILLYRRRRLA